MQAHHPLSKAVPRIIWTYLLLISLVTSSVVHGAQLLPRARMTDLTEHASSSGTKPAVMSWSSSSSPSNSPPSSPTGPNQIPLGRPAGKPPRARTSATTGEPPGTGAWTSDPSLAHMVFRTNSAQFRDLLTHGFIETPMAANSISKKGKEIVEGPPPTSPPMTWKQRQRMMSAAAARKPVLSVEQLRKQRSARGPASGTRNRVIADCASSVGRGVGSLWRAVAECFRGSGKRKLARQYHAIPRE